jgi:hypothetical protein
MRWLPERGGKKPPCQPPGASSLAVPVAFLTFTLSHDCHVKNAVYEEAEVPLDTAAELASEWLGGPYIAAVCRTHSVAWMGMRPLILFEHDVAIEALIVEEAYEAMYELEEMAQDGRWVPGPGMEWFRLQRHERLPMVPWNDVR